ncbi:hypothetical protein BGZ49_007539 [Haplosporangium sp. Z 27]|nr:hypothetical protein BGZ49_007539 [Haplosporangium sp. Z 27]
MLGRNYHDNNSQHVGRDHNTNNNSQTHTTVPQRPQRAKRPIPDPIGHSNLNASVSRLSLFEDHSLSSTSQSLPSSPSSVSLASSFNDVRRLDSGIDIQEQPRPLNRLSNREIRLTQADNQSRQRSTQQDVSPAILQKQVTKENKSPNIKLLHEEEQEEDSYFADILDKYCNSDEDQSAQPSTPPVVRSYIRPAPSSERTGNAAATAAPLKDNRPQLSDHLSQERNRSSQRDSKNNSTSDLLTPLPSPATSKFNVYFQSATVRNSRESLSKITSSPSSSPLLPSGQFPSTTPTTNNATRSYAKRPPPPTKDDSSASFVLPSKSPSSPFYQQSNDKNYRNNSSVNLGDLKPEPPSKDKIRRALHQQTTSSSNINGFQPPMLSLDTQSSDNFNSFSEVVEATMERHKASSLASNTDSRSYYNSESSAQTHSNSQLNSKSRNSSSHGSSGNVSQQTMSRFLDGDLNQSPKAASSPDDYGKNQKKYGYSQENSSHSRNQGGYEDKVYDSRQSYSQQQQQQQQQRQQRHSAAHDGNRLMHGSASQLDLSWSGHKSQNNSPSSSSTRASNQPANYQSERTRSHSYGSIQTNSSYAISGYPGSTRTKSALVKTPIARARAKEIRGSRKVMFGEMITIVTIERAETPPPAPPIDKKTKKKLLQAKKNSSGKNGQYQNFDPEYNAAFFDAPYTPTPAEVVVAVAPWIGNPNYDEEKQNSKFYNEDDIDYYDEDEYDTYESDIRLGPEDDDEDDEDEDEDEDDEEEYVSRKWGHGIAGPGGALPKKKGGMFKFKRAVNKLLRN